MTLQLRIQPLSDLHLEMHGECSIAATDADVIVLSGDIRKGARGITRAARESQRLGIWAHVRSL